MPETIRQTAYKILIKDLLKGKFIKQEGWNPSFVYIPELMLKVSRVNLMGVVVSSVNNEAGYKELIFDDGSGSITVRSFDENVNLDAEVGDILNIIGRVREFNNTIYIAPEIVKKYKDKRIKELWELERKAQKLPREELKLPEKPKEKVLDETNPKQIVYELIKELDKGDGVEISDIISKADVPDAESVIEGLIIEGEIFKVSSSRVKVL